jgi:hypothetical protein
MKLSSIDKCTLWPPRGLLGSKFPLNKIYAYYFNLLASSSLRIGPND